MGRFIRSNRASLIISGDAERHLAAHPEITDEMLLEGFRSLDLSTDKKEIRAEIRLGRILGRTSKIATPGITGSTETTFARRKSRTYASRVVVGEEMPLSDVLTLIAERNGGTRFMLRTAYIGDLAPPEPFSFNTIRKMRLQPEDVLSYWCSHALVYVAAECETEPFISTWDEILSQARLDREARRRAAATLIRAIA